MALFALLMAVVVAKGLKNTQKNTFFENNQHCRKALILGVESEEVARKLMESVKSDEKIHRTDR